MEDQNKKDMQEAAFQVDIEGIIASKNPSLAKLLPKFILSYIKRVLHEDELNDFVRRSSHRQGLDFAQAIIEEFDLNVETFHEDRIDIKGRYIFAANHPLGCLESMALLTTVAKYHKPLRFPVNDILMHAKNLTPLFLPINKQGSQSKETVIRLDETFASDEQILIFPAGLVSRKINGKITDLEWQKGFISKAIKHKRDIIPVYIHAQNSNFFYNLSRIRSKLKIKANLEMFFLSDEMFKFKGKKIQLVFGEPISYKTLTNNKRPKEWAQDIKSKTYSLSNILSNK